MPSIGTCFRFYTEMRVEKKTKHLHIEFIVTSHNSANIQFLHLRILYILRNIGNRIMSSIVKFLHFLEKRGCQYLKDSYTYKILVCIDGYAR